MRLGTLVLVIAAVAGCGGSDVSRMVGARCTDSADCDDKCLLPGGDWPGGFCTMSCDDDRDCPMDSVCVQDEGGVCLFTCAVDPDCDFLGTGWSCQARDARPSGDEVRVCRGD